MNSFNKLADCQQIVTIFILAVTLCILSCSLRKWMDQATAQNQRDLTTQGIELSSWHLIKFGHRDVWRKKLESMSQSVVYRNLACTKLCRHEFTCRHDKNNGKKFYNNSLSVVVYLILISSQPFFFGSVRISRSHNVCLVCTS